jgi:hypothetical protein
MLVWAVALKAIFGEDGPDIAIEFDRFRLFRPSKWTPTAQDTNKGQHKWQRAPALKVEAAF